MVKITAEYYRDERARTCYRITTFDGEDAQRVSDGVIMDDSDVECLRRRLKRASGRVILKVLGEDDLTRRRRPKMFAIVEEYNHSASCGSV